MGHEAGGIWAEWYGESRMAVGEACERQADLSDFGPAVPSERTLIPPSSDQTRQRGRVRTRFH